MANRWRTDCAKPPLELRSLIPPAWLSSRGRARAQTGCWLPTISRITWCCWILPMAASCRRSISANMTWFRRRSLTPWSRPRTAAARGAACGIFPAPSNSTWLPVASHGGSRFYNPSPKSPPDLIPPPCSSARMKSCSMLRWRTPTRWPRLILYRAR